MGRTTPATLVWLISPFFLFAPRAALGQTLHLSSPSGYSGEHVVIEISIKSPGAKEPPSTLQWEATISSAQLNFLDEGALTGPAAQSAGKSVSCALKTKTDEAQTSICILYGGQEPIRDGVIALLQLAISPGAKSGDARVRLDHGLAVSKNLTKVELPPAETHVRIRAK